MTEPPGFGWDTDFAPASGDASACCANASAWIAAWRMGRRELGGGWARVSWPRTWYPWPMRGQAGRPVTAARRLAYQQGIKPWPESIGRIVVQMSDTVAFIATLQAILHQKLILELSFRVG